MECSFHISQASEIFSIILLMPWLMYCRYAILRSATSFPDEGCIKWRSLFLSYLNVKQHFIIFGSGFMYTCPLRYFNGIFQFSFLHVSLCVSKHILSPFSIKHLNRLRTERYLVLCEFLCPYEFRWVVEILHENFLGFGSWWLRI